MEKLSFPDRITIDLTNQCNVSCTFCPRQSVPMTIGYMEPELYYKIIDEAARHLPVKLVMFFRGESLLHPEFMQFLNYAKKKGIGPIQFATNAYAMDRETTDALIEAEIDFVSFSLDTLDPQVYKKSRLKGDLKVSMDHVLYMSNRCKERRKSGLSSPKLQVSTIEIEDYLDGQKAFIDFWRNYVDVVRVYYEHDDYGRFRNCELQKQLEQAVPDRQPCRKVFTDMLIYWNGELALCNYDWRGGIPGLNVKDISLQDAWNSSEYEEIREMHRKNHFTDSIMCNNCGHWRIDYMETGFLGKSYPGML
ncbi:MAG: radical SAM protein [Lachnospiraceae bacterium]|nr:radical SAM protein [Lachnospiraceae bacterium]